MDPVFSHIHVEHRIATLAREACVERLVAAGRRRHEEEHHRHPALRHPHDRIRVRRAIGRLLIGVGCAIAGSESNAGAPGAA